MNVTYRSHFSIVACFFCLINVSAFANAEPHNIRQRGKTLIEAENYSAVSKNYPYGEPCTKCSGQNNLGFFWKDSWFEIEVQIPDDSVYDVSLRASSVDGTSIELLDRDRDDAERQRIGLFNVPKTREWSRYAVVESIKLSLTAGKHTLRFKNLGEGANVDFITFAAASQDQITSYSPPKSVGPYKNPLKGFGSGWWRADDDYATVGFQYIQWRELEPKDNQFDWSYVEEVLNREGTRGRHLILQFVVDWDYREPVEANYLGPDWLLKKVGEHRGLADPKNPSSRKMRATKYNNPAYIEEATEAIEALTGYFKDDPRVFVLQAGLLGFWSEWHTFPREDWSPNPQTKRAILDAYLKNLPAASFTQIRYPNEESVQPRIGIGYTNGSATPTNHGYEFGKVIEQQSLWKNGPITGEWPPNVEKQYWKRFFQTNEGEKFVRQARYSTLLMPEQKQIKQQLPGWKTDDRFMSMHQQMGYNLQAQRVRHLVSDDDRLHLEIKLHNAGIAPFYQDWNVQLGILDGRNVVETISLDTDLRKLGPGTSSVLKCVSTQKYDRNHNHRIGLRILQPGADQNKTKRWPLEARNVYVVLANEVDVVDGMWGKRNELAGGWNIVCPSPMQVHETSFPFAGSFRPAK